MAYLFSLTFLALIGCGVRVLWNYKRASPVFWQLMAFSLIGLGTAPLLDFELSSDRTYALCMILALLVFVLITSTLSTSARMPALVAQFRSSPLVQETRGEILVIRTLFLLSIAISAYYYYEIGYNVFLLTLTEGGSNFVELRLATYSGEEYFAPGYVNQFKNTLLPICSVSLAAIYYKRAKRTNFLFVAFFLLIINFVFLLGTGQRAFLIYTLGSLVFGLLLYTYSDQHLFRIRSLLPLIGVISVAFLFMTFYYRGGGQASLFEVLNETVSRFTEVQQFGGLVAFRYIYQLPIVWFADWARAFIGILPGEQGSLIAHEVFRVMYGSTRGTTPLSTVGTAYHNGGLFGVIVLYGLMGLIYHKLYVRFLVGQRSISRCISYGFMFFYLAIYVAETPVILVNNGIVSIIIFLLALKIGRTLKVRRN